MCGMTLQDLLKNEKQHESAKRLSVSQNMISKWARGERVSAEKVRLVCEAYDWQVTPHELRPDLYPHPQDGLPEHLRVTEVKKAVA